MYEIGYGLIAKVVVACSNTLETWFGPGQFSLYSMSDADFHMVCLYIQIVYEYGVSFESVRHLQEYCRDHFYSRCVTVFLTMTTSLGCKYSKQSFVKASKSFSLRGPCKVRNEKETKRNKSKRKETDRNETKKSKRNETKLNETNRNETKQIIWPAIVDKNRYFLKSEILSYIRNSFFNIEKFIF